MARLLDLSARIRANPLKGGGTLSYLNELKETEQVSVVSLDDMWKALSERDLRYDGSFVYAVRSTTIYCRPSCASRKPRPDRVVFFSGPTEAQKAGFRA